MIAFIDDHRAVYGVGPICAVLPIAPSTYYQAKRREADRDRLPERAKRDATLREAIRRVWETNFRVYGARKIWRQLLREGIRVRIPSDPERAFRLKPNTRSERSRTPIPTEAEH